MAKGKKKRAKYTSQGKINRSSGIFQAIAAGKSELDKLNDKRVAWEKGQNPWLTIENPSKNETNRPFIRVRADNLWGDPKNSKPFDMFAKKAQSDATTDLL
jgi:hypothetical protein